VPQGLLRGPGLPMITTEQAREFAEEWIEAWNAHDLDRILAHYADDIEMTTPFIVQVMGEPTGTLRGKDKVGAYWAAALERVPDLRFELVDVLSSVNSITIYYKAVFGKMGAELLFLNAEGKVNKSVAHYDEV